MLRIAHKSDLPGITTLWGEAFGDSPETVSCFFHSFSSCVSYVAEDQGRIVSMVHALPHVLSPDIPAAYIYAVATLQAYRGAGLCRQLMAFAEEDLNARGFSCCVLTPGEPSLFEFYKKLGYETAFTRSRAAFETGTSISLEEYMQLREQLLTVPHVIYDRNTLEYARDCYSLTFYQTATGCAAASDHYTAERLPEDLSDKPFAMVKWLDEPRKLQGAYLGFALE